ncbi:COP9 signalosome [Thamnidium elegans]|nr:COP9 signalosome [Thamnidium elegans]
MTDIVDYIRAKDYAGLVRRCEELEIHNAVDASITLEHIYPVYLAACILIDDLQSARYLRKRILASNISSPEINAVWSVVTALIKKEYPLVYQNLDSFQWTQYMQPLTERIKLKIRENMLTLIPKVYSSIEVTQVSNYFGMTDVLLELTSRGWQLDESTGILIPAKPDPAPRVATDMNQFAKLSDIVLNLEKF